MTLLSAITVAFWGEGGPGDVWVEAARSCGINLFPARSERELIDLVETCSTECVVGFSANCVDDKVLRLIGNIRAIDHRCPIILLSHTISTEAALAVLRAGASDLLEGDASAQAVVASIKALSYRFGEKHPKDPPALTGNHRLVGTCTAMSNVRSQIARIAASDANVMVTGESGTGKELVAELIHQNSQRRNAPFVAVNCAAIPEALLESELFGYDRGAFTGAATAREGKLQHADSGTLFLDEIGDMSLVSQAKILRAIESRVIQRLGSNVDTPVRFRIVAATNQNLEALVQERRFRQDLYFRLNVIRLELPPLRDRSEDIPEMADEIVRELSQRHGQPLRRLESDVIRRLQRHTWPGNVRESRNVLESILVYSDSRSIGLADVPPHVRKTLVSRSPRPDERSRILSILDSANWNRNKAAAMLGCSRMTLYRKMVKYSVNSSQI